MIIQFNQGLEPLIERFYGLAAASINAPASRTAVELLADEATAMRLITWLKRLVLRRVLRIAFVLRAHEPSASAFSLIRPFHSLGQMITVIPAVGRNILRLFGQVLDFVAEAWQSGVDASSAQNRPLPILDYLFRPPRGDRPPN